MPEAHQIGSECHAAEIVEPGAHRIIGQRGDYGHQGGELHLRALLSDHGETDSRRNQVACEGLQICRHQRRERLAVQPAGDANGDGIRQLDVGEIRQIRVRPGGPDEAVKGGPLLHRFEPPLARKRQGCAQLGKFNEAALAGAPVRLAASPPGFADQHGIVPAGTVSQNRCNPPGEAVGIRHITGFNGFLDTVGIREPTYRERG